jgi:hypothetical protein
LLKENFPETSKGEEMIWSLYVACFFAGAFLSNFVPHFVQGVCGNRFPTPFSKPPGKGLSSAPVNMVWSLVNLAAAMVLFHLGHVAHGGRALLYVFLAGFAILSILHSVHFQHKDAS